MLRFFHQIRQRLLTNNKLSKYLLYAVGGILLVVILLLFLSCRINTKGDIEVEGKDVVEGQFIDQCWTPQDRKLILEEIVQSSEFQLYLHPELLERLPIRIAINKHFNTDISVESNGYRILFVDSSKPYTEDIHRIDIIDLDCEKGLLKYVVEYPIEGIFISGICSKKEGLWVTEKIQTFQE